MCHAEVMKMNDNKMWALVKEKPEQGLWLKRVQIPEVGPNDVKIKIHKNAICGTDVHIYQWNEWAQHTIPIGLTAGHEYVGEVVEVGAGVQGFKVGDLVNGLVAKIASFGAFVNLDGDIDGLIHISQLSEDHVERVKDVIKVGDEITARVIKVDSIERRIGLSIKAVNYDTEQLRRETASFEALRPSSDMVGLEHAFNLATRENEEWSPSEEK